MLNRETRGRPLGFMIVPRHLTPAPTYMRLFEVFRGRVDKGTSRRVNSPTARYRRFQPGTGESPLRYISILSVSSFLLLLYSVISGMILHPLSFVCILGIPVGLTVVALALKQILLVGSILLLRSSPATEFAHGILAIGTRFVVTEFLGWLGLATMTASFIFHCRTSPYGSPRYNCYYK